MKVVKISDNIHEKLKELAEKRNISINQLIEEILNVYLGGSSDKAIKRIVSVDIVNEYENKHCSKCKKTLSVGETIHYVRYEYVDNTYKYYIYCLDCWYSTSALAKQYLSKKKLELTIKGLKQEADKLAGEIRQLQEQLEQLKIELNTREILKKTSEELYFLLSQQLITRRDYDNLLHKLQEILLLLEELDKKTKPIEIKEKIEEKMKKTIKKTITQT